MSNTSERPRKLDKAIRPRFSTRPPLPGKSAFIVPWSSRTREHGIISRSGGLSRGRHAMQDLVREAIKRELLQAFLVDESDIPLFKNLNSAEDLQDM